jgi:hypothetical protein
MNDESERRKMNRIESAIYWSKLGRWWRKGGSYKSLTNGRNLLVWSFLLPAMLAWAYFLVRVVLQVLR